LYDFGAQMFSYCKLLQPLKPQYKQCYEEFASYKSLIPTSGCILLNEACDKVLLVQNWKKTCWGFPKGKVNENEDPAECAMREVDEEIGYCPQVNRDDCIVLTADNGQTSFMYIVPNVPEDFHFEPRARKEISKIEFFYLNAPLPNERFNTLKYKSEIAKWIKKYKKRRAKNASSNKSNKDGQMAESVSSLFGMCPSVVAPRAATLVHDSVSDSPKSVIAAVQTSAQADNGGKFTFKLDDMFAIPAN
jgi:8-oxo-dGTP pyrophosphatase MutT (NUDIX family)